MPGVLAPYSLTFSRIAIGVVFAASSLGKLRDFPAFERAVGDFHILPRQLVGPCARLFLAGEIAAVMLMLSGAEFLRIGFLLASVLLSLFSMALLSVLFRRNVGFLACALATYAGRRVAFVFVSPPCSPCREELPRLQTLWPKAGQAGMELVLVSDADEERTLFLVEEIMDSLPVLVAPRDRTSFLADYKAMGTPSYCLVDVQGKVQAVGVSVSELEKTIDALLLAAQGGGGRNEERQ